METKEGYVYVMGIEGSANKLGILYNWGECVISCNSCTYKIGVGIIYTNGVECM